MNTTSQVDNFNPSNKQIYELLKEILANLNSSIGEWIIKKQVMKILDYGETQMNMLMKTGKLEYRKFGNRIFFKRDSILKLIEDGKDKN